MTWKAGRSVWKCKTRYGVIDNSVLDSSELHKKKKGHVSFHVINIKGRRPYWTMLGCSLRFWFNYELDVLWRYKKKGVCHSTRVSARKLATRSSSKSMQGRTSMLGSLPAVTPAFLFPRLWKTPWSRFAFFVQVFLEKKGFFGDYLFVFGCFFVWFRGDPVVTFDQIAVFGLSN